MWDWFKRLCAAPETLTPLAGAAPFKRTPQQLTQAPPQASDAAKRRDQDAAPCPASGTGNPAVADSDAAAPATPLAPNPHKGAADCNGGGGGAPMTPTFSNAATAGTPAHTRAAAYTPEVSSRTPPHARTPDARAVAAGTPGGAGAAGREPSPFTPDAHAAGKGPGAGGRQVDEGTPGRARAPSMPPCTGASVASRVSTGGFLIEGGKVGMPQVARAACQPAAA